MKRPTSSKGSSATNTSAAFIEGAESVSSLFVHPVLADRWTQPSVLAGFSTRGLAGHLLRAVTVTTDVITLPEPTGHPVPIAEFLAGVSATWDAQANSIRARGEAESADGPGELARRYAEATEDLRRALESSTPTRRVLRQDCVLDLDDFLVLRAIELIVHADDLALTIGASRPRFAELIERAVISLLVDTAIVRHGRPAVVTALTRRERDTASALRVI